MYKKITIVIENLSDTEYMDLVKRVNDLRIKVLDLDAEVPEVIDFEIPGGTVIKTAMVDELLLDFSTKINMATFRPESASAKLSYLSQ